MLIGIDQVLSADLLYVLASMGHGDDLVLVDANFPGDSVARETASGELISLPGISLARAARAILSVYPIDGYVDDPVRRMQVIGKPDEVPPVQAEVQAEIIRAAGEEFPAKLLELKGIERYAFYDTAKKGFAVVQVSDPRAYGCFLIRKGVVFGEPG